MSDLRCINCQRDIGPDELVYEIRTSLGVACSEQCQQQKENESKQRAMLFYQVMGNPFGGNKSE
jgi:predicted nucleic acid-binding Zn ribbon protein